MTARDTPHSEDFAADCEGYGGAPAWIENIGVRPALRRVDLKFNQDEETQPGVPLMRFNVDPRGWDWSTKYGGLLITHYREHV